MVDLAEHKLLMPLGVLLIILGSAGQVQAMNLQAKAWPQWARWPIKEFINPNTLEAKGVMTGEVSPAISRNMTAQSLCEDGVLLPELFLLGASKCGTTSLARDLMNSGVASNSEPVKESQILPDICEGHSKFLPAGQQLSRNLRQSARAEAWQRAAARNKCGSPTPKRVIADYTPDNFKFAASPPEWGAKDWTPCENLPLMLKQLYSPAHVSRLQFVVMVREPLQRYQSAFYWMTRVFMGARGKDIDPGVFEGQVSRVLDLVRQKQAYTNRAFWESLYGRQLQGWLNYFEPRQFYVIPYRHYARAGGKDAVFADLSAKLDVEIQALPDDGDGVSIGNEGEHPALDDDCSPAVQAEFQQLIAPENELLVRLLASASTEGLGLARYQGAPGSKADVKSWLEAGW